MSKANRLGPAAAHERFERAVEGTPDPAFAEDARLVERLRERADEVTLPTLSRVRIAAGLRTELEQDAEPAASGETPPSERANRRRSPLGIALAVACSLLLLFGAIGATASKNALPGQPFYDLKRGIENAALGLTFDEQTRTDKRLNIAQRRISDLAKLSPEHETSGRNYRAALADFEAETGAAARASIQLGTNGGSETLTRLHDWSDQQRERLLDLRDELPTEITARLERSISMLAAIESRTEALSARLGCSRITSGHQDTIGLLPAVGRCLDPDVRVAAGGK